MFNIRSALSNLQFLKIVKPMGLFLILSIIYNLFYFLIGVTTYQSTYIQMPLQVILSFISSMGYYYLCVLFWGKRKLEFREVRDVLFFQLLYVLIVSGILHPLYNIFYSNGIILMIVQFLSGLILLSVPVIQLLYFHALYDGCHSLVDVADYIKYRFICSGRGIWNGYCALLLIVLTLDTILNGVFSLANGFNAFYVLNGVLYLANPMFEFVMVSFFSFSVEGGISYFVVYLVLGLILAFFESNYLYYIDRKCKTDGSE